MEFDEILIEEPRLIGLICDAYHNRHLSTKGRNNYWYKNIKPEFVKLVGFYAENGKLCTTDVYNTVYRFFINFMRI